MSAPGYPNLNSNYSATQNGGGPGTTPAYLNGTGLASEHCHATLTGIFCLGGFALFFCII